MGLSRAPEMVGREALWKVVRETTEDRRRRPRVNPTPSVFCQIARVTWGRDPPFGLNFGWVAERLKAHDWKSCGLIPSWVRIPPHPLGVVGSSRGGKL